MTEHEQWRPACDLKILQVRAQLLDSIRSFFKQRSVLEVETPLLCHATGTDPQLDFFSSYYHLSANNKDPKVVKMFLQTSPEFAMKRLLAAGSGSIFQISKAFRNGESGRFHNPEFTILEWYKTGFDLQQLMNEVGDFLLQILNQYCSSKSIQKLQYHQLFEQVTGLNPLHFNLQRYQAYAQENSIGDAINICSDDHSLWLDFIFSYKIQPKLDKQSITMIYGYPAIQSCLARINRDNSQLADRFEVFVNGIEIGNGFFELSDAEEQEQRFDRENQSRKINGLPQVEKDRHFLDALSFGLPDCSGIAIGIDRLLMLISNEQSISKVIAFPYERA